MMPAFVVVMSPQYNMARISNCDDDDCICSSNVTMI